VNSDIQLRVMILMVVVYQIFIYITRFFKCISCTFVDIYKGGQNVYFFAMPISLSKLSILRQPTYTKITANRKGVNNDELTVLSAVCGDP